MASTSRELTSLVQSITVAISMILIEDCILFKLDAMGSPRIINLLRSHSNFIITKLLLLEEVDNLMEVWRVTKRERQSVTNKAGINLKLNHFHCKSKT